MSVLTTESEILLTGATGLIGGEMLRSLLTHRVRRIWALVRNDNRVSPREQLVRRLARSGGLLRDALERKVRAVVGDVRAPALGIAAQLTHELGRRLDLIVHCAADTSFVRESDCYNTNVGGLHNLLGLCAYCRHNPLVLYFSTASNYGLSEDRLITEDEWRGPMNNHYNCYTWSKALAEDILARSGARCLIVKPSIVLSAGLHDRAFARSVLWAAPLIGEFECLPLRSGALVDIVPVGRVTDWALRLMNVDNPRWNCYHLSAGTHAQTLGELCAVVRRHYGFRRSLTLVPPQEWTRSLQRRAVRTPRQRRAFAALRYYIPFVNMNVIFDRTRLESEIGVREAACPRPSEYIDGLLRLVRTSEAWLESENP